MSGGLGPVTVEVQFNGESYVAEITPTINGKPVALRPEIHQEMHQAEAAYRIYTSQLQTLLSKPELRAGYQHKYGFLTEMTSNGFVFENGRLGHPIVTTENLWKGFVDSLHRPESFLSSRSIAAAAPNISAYMSLSANEKKEVHVSVLFKVLKEFQGEVVDRYTDPEMQYLQCVIHKHRIPSAEKEILLGQLFHNLRSPENIDERFSEEEMNDFFT
jgi:hypothetical protein